jgi:nitroimidazol reductase NimA-like FMN-containing flavoprotein (pyridoxamine 5'-phosphate oxidase superfamily)
MLIENMTRQEGVDLLKQLQIGRIACAHEGQPYITAISFAYDSDCLYCISTVGQKIAWMRANPLVCVEADRSADRQNWASVIVFGRYEELTDTPEHERARKHAYDLLQRDALWWEPAYVKPPSDEAGRTLEIVYFRVHIDQISGRRGRPDELRAPRERWLQRLLGQSPHQ